VKKGDIVLIPFPFSDLTGNKLRPALVLISSKNDVTVCFITTQFKCKNKFDIEIFPSSENGIKKESIIRLNKFATLDKKIVLGKIGVIDINSIKRINSNLKKILELD